MASDAPNDRQRDPPIAASIRTVMGLHAVGRQREALSRAAALVRDNPCRAEFWDTLAVCAMPRDPARARVAARFALILKPSAVMAQQIVFAGEHVDRPRDAIRHLRRALAVMPDLADLWIRLAASIRLLAVEPPRASLERRAAVLAPGAPSAWVALGDWAKAAGDKATAVAGHRRAALVSAPSPARLYDIALVEPRAVPRDLRDTIDRQARAGELGGEALETAGYALGLCCDAEDDRDAAFEWFSRANATRAARMPETHRYNQLLLERSLATTMPALDVPRDPGARHPTPIFIVGQPSSGTTLLESMLAMHPRIDSAGELPTMNRIAGSLTGYPESLTDLDAATARTLIDAYREGMAQVIETDAPFVIDKMPTNFTLLGLVRLLFPDAPILHVSRHPMAVGWSQFRRRFRDGHAFSLSLERIAEYMAIHDRFMGHWDRVLPGAVLRVSYEALVEDPRRELERALDRIGLPWDPACVAYETAARRINTASAIAVRRAPDPRRLDDWRRYERHLEPLRRAYLAQGIEL